MQSQKCSLIVAYKPDRLDYHFEMKVDDLKSKKCILMVY